MVGTKRPAARPLHTRPCKRKAAEAGLVKMKVIADAEDEDIEEDLDEMVVPDDNIATDVDEDDVGSVDFNNIEERNDQDEESVTGYRSWETTSTLISGAAMSDTAKFNTSTQKFSHVLDIQSTDAFNLKPMLITQGPYKGRRIIMLEPVAGFPFLELPAEVRNIIYSHLLEEDKPIRMDTTKVTHQPRRPVRLGFRSSDGHTGLTWNRNTHKWIDQSPSAHTILRVNKQIFRETVSIAYGNNRFDFDNLSDLKYFLDQIDSLRPYIRHIHIEGKWGIPHNNSKAAFRGLKEATNLRTLSFFHVNVCRDGPPRWGYTISSGKLVSDCATLLRALRRAHRQSKSGVDVLDIIKVETGRCAQCKRTEPEYAENCESGYFSLCKTACKDAVAHCQEAEEKIRQLIAKELKISV